MKRKLIAFGLCLGLLATLAQSSEAGRLFKWHVDEEGSGTEASEVRDLDAFERIDLKGSADISVRIGPEQKVTVTTDDNLLDNIVTRVRGRHTLQIDTKGSFSTEKGIKIDIVVPSLTYVGISGSGDVQVDGLKQEAIEIEIEGSGDVNLSGEVDRIEVDVAGSGDIDARSLKAKSAYVDLDGSGDVDVFASEDFDGTVNGSGDITVYGNPPRISRSVHGSGDISMR